MKRLIIFIIILLIALSYSYLKPYPEKVTEVNLKEMPLKEKIAQMMMIQGKYDNLDEVSNLNIGGIFIGSATNEKSVNRLINKFQKKSKYPLFVATDLEGCVNTLENIQEFKYFSEIKTNEEARQLGVEMGILLKRLGFNINFAPVLDQKDTIWNCRSFIGTPEEISKKGKNFIEGIESTGVMSTAKHFPGRTLDVGDTHKISVWINITQEDIQPFYEAVKENVSIVMLNHLIVYGYVDSKDKPSSLSKEVIENLKINNYTGMIVTDDLKMKAISSMYEEEKEVYIDAINAGDDILLNVHENNSRGAINYIEKAVIDGKINPKLIDEAVIKILNTKGIKIIE